MFVGKLAVAIISPSVAPVTQIGPVTSEQQPAPSIVRKCGSLDIVLARVGLLPMQPARALVRACLS